MGTCCACLPGPPLAEADARVSSSSLPNLPIKERRASLLSLGLESYAWMKQRDSKGALFYFSVVTGETRWTAPDCYAQCAKEALDLVEERDLPDAIRVCEERGITLTFPSSKEVLVDPHFKNDIKGVRPKLAHCIFYQALLVAGLSLYPPDFVYKTGLKTIVLIDKLHYKSQARKAVPVFATGTLYLDPAPEIIAYLQDVFHHEYFHMIDTKMAQLKLTGAHVSSSGKVVDKTWEALNVADFQYGSGGSKNRQPEGFINSNVVQRGFLNTYSMTAVEEDKAEIYAGLIRHPGAMLEAADSILQAKSVELLRRLVMFCPSIDEKFWHAVVSHEPYPIKCMIAVDESAWETRATGNGKYTFWFNHKTNQHSWLNPTFKKAFSQALPTFLIHQPHVIEAHLLQIQKQQHMEQDLKRQLGEIISPDVKLQILIPQQLSQQQASQQPLQHQHSTQQQHTLKNSPHENELQSPPSLISQNSLSHQGSLTSLKIVIDPPSSPFVNDHTTVFVAAPPVVTSVRGDTTTTILTTKKRAFFVETTSFDDSPPSSPTSSSSSPLFSSSSSPSSSSFTFSASSSSSCSSLSSSSASSSSFIANPSVRCPSPSFSCSPSVSSVLYASSSSSATSSCSSSSSVSSHPPANNSEKPSSVNSFSSAPISASPEREGLLVVIHEDSSRDLNRSIDDINSSA